jgi:hypothetical protein
MANNFLSGGLLGMGGFGGINAQPPSLLGEFYDPKMARNAQIKNMLLGMGVGLMSEKGIGRGAELALTMGNQAQDDYRRMAFDQYRMKQAEDERAYGRERDAKADERWQMQYDDNKGRQQKADAWQNTQMDWQMQDRQQQEDMQAGQQNAVEGFAQDFTSQGGDLFDPGMQGWLRGQGVQGVNPQDTQRYDRMQPYMAAQDYGGAFQQMTAEPAQPDLPNSYEEYMLAQQDPRFAEYQTQQKRAGAAQTNIDMKQENAFAGEAGKVQAKILGDYLEDGKNAAVMSSNVNMLRELGAQVNTGKGAEVMVALGPYAEYFGVDIGGLGEAQAYEAIVARIIPTMRPAGSGPASDFDARQFVQSLPQLGQTPEGNAIIENTLEALSEHKMAAAQIAEMAFSGQIEPAQAFQMIRELGDPWSMWKQARDQYAVPQQQNPNAPRIRKYNRDTGRLE